MGNIPKMKKNYDFFFILETNKKAFLLHPHTNYKPSN